MHAYVHSSNRLRARPRREFAVVALTLCVGGCLASDPGATYATGGVRVKGVIFSAQAPAGWKTARDAVGSHSPAYGSTYSIVSRGRANELNGMPPPGAVAITIDRFAIPKPERGYRTFADGRGILRQVVAFVGSAEQVTETESGQAPLDRGTAATETYTFTDSADGRHYWEQDDAIRHGVWAIHITTIADAANRARAEHALRHVEATWRWR